MKNILYDFFVEFELDAKELVRVIARKTHSKDDTVFHPATILKIFSIHDFSFTAA